MEQWYREQVKSAAPALVAKRERLMGAKVQRIFAQRMKTKWGSCHQSAGTIRLDTDLAKKLRECLEYILVHEMADLLEPTHNERFMVLMDRFMPRWLSYRETLNRLPCEARELGLLSSEWESNRRTEDYLLFCFGFMAKNIRSNNRDTMA